MIDGRITFPGNPWPNGHRVIECALTANLQLFNDPLSNGNELRRRLAVGVELRTADYDEEPPTTSDDDPDATDWNSPGAWTNYGSCWLGPSASSETPGITVSDGTVPFAFGAPNYRFTSDMLPVEWDRFMATAAFGIYLQGHDAVAGHEIALHSRQDNGTYTVDWTGRIASAYIGHTTFDHTFVAHITGVSLESIMMFDFDADRMRDYFGLDWNPSHSARDELAPFVADIDSFTFELRDHGIGRQVTYAIPPSI